MLTFSSVIGNWHLNVVSWLQLFQASGYCEWCDEGSPFCYIYTVLLYLRKFVPCHMCLLYAMVYFHDIMKINHDIMKINHDIMKINHDIMKINHDIMKINHGIK